MDWSFIGKMLWGTIFTSHNILVSIPTYIATLPVILFFFPSILTRWGKNMNKEAVKKKIRKLAITAVIILLFVSLVLSASHLYQNKQVKLATPDELLSSSLNGLTIRLTDLARESDLITNKTFENCRIYGPAVMGANDTDIFYNCEFYGNKNEMLITTINYSAIGVVGCNNCVFRNCQFYRISFIGNADYIQNVEVQIQWIP